MRMRVRPELYTYIHLFITLCTVISVKCCSYHMAAIDFKLSGHVHRFISVACPAYIYFWCVAGVVVKCLTQWQEFSRPSGPAAVFYLYRAYMLHTSCLNKPLDSDQLSTSKGSNFRISVHNTRSSTHDPLLPFRFRPWWSLKKKPSSPNVSSTAFQGTIWIHIW